VRPTVAEYQQLLYNAYTGQVGQSPDNEGAVNPEGPSLPDVGGGLEAIGSFFAALLQWSTWMRVLQLAAGVALVAGGLFLINRDSIGPAVKTAALAAAA
jgi:hypothetical protein